MKSTHPLIAKLLGDATRLTQSGRLADATAAIQRALKGTLSPAAPVAPNEGAPASPRAAGDVLEGLVRELPPAARRPAAPDPTLSDGPVSKEADANAEARFEAGSFSGEFGARQYKLFTPPGAGRKPLPLVVMLHGCTQDPDDFAAGTQMNKLGGRRGFYVLYPAQAPRSNSSKCWNWFQPGDQRRGRGEPALLAAMTRHVMATERIDANRVYVAGLSAGGAMAAILGREYADLFAAVGVHSGLAQGAAHDVASAFSTMRSGHAAPAPAGGAPVIVFHGDHDQTVHPDHGNHVIGDLRATATLVSESGDAGRAFTRHSYRDAKGRVSAEHWLVHGAGHAWSGGHRAGSFTDAAGPDATGEMVRFFLEHPRGGRA